MDMTEVETVLKKYIVQEVLEGDEQGLTSDTPLLEWGVLNSMEMRKLTRFIFERLGVEIPFEEVVPENFMTIGTIGALVERLQGG